jgi:anti-sigma factor (TIGR02949 family)
MTDCGCEKAKAELEEYLHNELCTEDAADIREHLESCADCQSEHHLGRVLTEAVQRACRETAPEDLRAQVLVSIRTIQSTHVTIER